MTVVLVVLALLCGFGGTLLASQVTSGAALVALGCLFAILARVAQAQHHHQRLSERLDELMRRAP